MQVCKAAERRPTAPAPALALRFREHRDPGLMPWDSEELSGRAEGEVLVGGACRRMLGCGQGRTNAEVELGRPE